MRGKVTALDRKDHAFRITPAYAGKSDGLHIVLSMIQGSPPPMRGKANPHHLV